MLRKDYIFFGIVNFSEKLTANYKFIYRKTLKYNSSISYFLTHHKGILSYEDIEKYIKLNTDKVLISVMKTYNPPVKGKPKSIKDNFLIFKQTYVHEQDKVKYDYLLTEVVKDKYTEYSKYLKDISNKMNLFTNDESVKFNLTCCVNNDTSLIMVFYEKLENEETPMERNSN
jgi:hypothetical protein